MPNLGQSSVKKSRQDYNESEAAEETEELNKAVYRINNWYVMTPCALLWQLIETNYSLTVNHALKPTNQTRYRMFGLKGDIT